MNKKIAYTILVVAVWISGVVGFGTYNSADRVYTNESGAVSFRTESFDLMVMSAPATMTVTSTEPFSLQTTIGIIDTQWEGEDKFSVGPVLVQTAIKFRYSDGVQHYSFDREDEGSLTVTFGGARDDRTFYLLAWVVFGGLVAYMLLKMGIWSQSES